MIAKHAGQMVAISAKTVWHVLQTPEYHLQSIEFRRSTEASRESTEKKHLDGAASPCRCDAEIRALSQVISPHEIGRCQRHVVADK
jgi:hypothetical protein